MTPWIGEDFGGIYAATPEEVGVIVVNLSRLKPKDEPVINVTAQLRDILEQEGGG